MKMRKLCILTVLVLLCTLVAPVGAIDQNDDVVSWTLIDGVHIPEGAKQAREGESVVYYDFYDSVHGMHYSFYNTETGEYFAMSDPYYEVSGDGTLDARSTQVIARNYSFRTSESVNGKNTGNTFTLPEKGLYQR